jgi:hypothetical protein
MFHLTLFSYAQARLLPEGSTCFTLFGSTILAAPTVAQRIARLAQHNRAAPTRWQRLLGSDQVLLLTLFGYTEITLPTLVEEYAALRELSAREGVPRDQLRRLCEKLQSHDSGGLDTATLSVFGHCQIGRPTSKRELAAIERARKLGDIDSSVSQALERLVGRTEAAIIGGLAQTTLA